jgi:hypothetical protein
MIENPSLCAVVILPLIFLIFKRMFKKKERKSGRKPGKLSRKDLEDWARVQQLLKEKESAQSSDIMDGPLEIKEGYNYLVEELKPERSYTAFNAMIDKGFEGLCITHIYPKKIRSLYGVKNVPVFWLSDWYGASQEFLEIGSEEKTLRPTRLDFEVMKELGNFIKKSKKKGVLILDGIESLAMANPFEKVVSFLTSLNNMASAHHFTIIAPINPGVFKRRDRFILQKIYDEVASYVRDFSDDE